MQTAVLDAALHEVRGFVDGQPCRHAVDKKKTAAVFHNGFFLICQLIHKAVFFCLRACPPARGIHLGGHILLRPAGLSGVQAGDGVPDHVQRVHALAQVLLAHVVTDAHPHRMDHIDAVIGRHHSVAVAGDDGGRAGAQPVNLGRHHGGILFQQVADGLGRKDVAAARIDSHGDLAHRAKGGQLIRKLLCRYIVFIPAVLCDVAVQHQLGALATCNVAELPEVPIRRLCGSRRRRSRRCHCHRLNSFFASRHMQSLSPPPSV